MSTGLGWYSERRRQDSTDDNAGVHSRSTGKRTPKGLPRLLKGKIGLYMINIGIYIHTGKGRCLFDKEKGRE